MRNSEGHMEVSVVYEVGYLILPSISEEKLDDLVGSVRKLITKEGGTEIDAEAPFKYPLAYPMSKTIGASHYVLTDAYLGWIKFEVESEKISTIKAGLEKIGEILRFLLVKAPRETTFTFAKARAIVEAKKEEKEGPAPVLAEEAVVE